VARGIASVVDNDTRDDLELPEEPSAPSDGPRSEGRPAARIADADRGSSPQATGPPGPSHAPGDHDPTRMIQTKDRAGPPDAGPEAREAPPEDARETEEAPAPEPRAEDMTGAPLTPSETAEPEDDPETPAPPPATAAPADFEPIFETSGADETSETPPIAPDAAAGDGPHWHAAIAEVLSESERAPAVETAAPALSAAQPEPPSAPETADLELPAAFTSAADGLFHPPPAVDRDPHLVTLGRRLTAQILDRPAAPAISSAPAIAPAGPAGQHPLWERARDTWGRLSGSERVRLVARYAAYAAGGYLALVLVLIVLFRFVNPPGSMLMLTQALTGTVPHRTWVPLEAISPSLVRAVVVSEDDRFCVHHGIDTGAMIQAIRQSGDGIPRGASTISMQVVKNLFLWSAKSYVRKLIEIPLTLFMELVWPKERILEVYLNIAEWGPGIFGAEAAARYHFSRHAAQLGPAEAALMAAALPNPIDRVAGDPGPQTTRKARVVQARVKAYGAVASCVIGGAAPQASSVTAGRKPAATRKPPLRPRVQRKRKVEDGWGPTLQFGN